MSEQIKNVGLYQQTLNNNIKFPIGNTGEDTAFTLNMGQIKTYMENNIQLNYSQVINAPQIGDAIVEIFQNGQLAGKFTLNQREDVAINLTGGGGGGGTGQWGDITGDIYQQSDLIQLMDDKINGLATVASSGSYNDLTNKPTIGNGTITLRQAGQQKGNFSLNQTGNLTVDLDGVQYTEMVTGNTPSIDVKANTIYKCTGTLTSLTLSDVENSQFESDIYFTTGTNCTLTYPPTIDAVVGPTTLKDDTKYVIAIKDFKMVIGMDGFDPSDYQTTVVDNHPNLAYGQTSTVGTINGTALTVTMPSAGTVSVVDNNPTLSWSTQSTVATIGGTAIHVTMPSQPTFTQTQANWNETDTGSAAYIQNKPSIPAAQVNSDWDAVSGVSQILNKPTIPSAANDSTITIKGGDSSNNTTFGSFTTDQSSASTIYIPEMVGATGSVAGTRGIVPQPASTDNTKFLKGDGTWDTPSFTQTQANWNESDTGSAAYIQNKPTIPAAPVQSDWNESDNTSLAYIANKPTIPVLPSYSTETWTFTLSDNSTITRTVYIVPSV